MMKIRYAGTALTALLVASCAPVAAPQPAAVPAPAAADTAVTYPLAIRWARASAERHALVLQTYRGATERLPRLVEGREPGSWAVILDADETVIDNTTYELRLVRAGGDFSPDSWNAWVREMAATAVPGAVEFTRAVERLGGRVVIVTNRDAEVCAPTAQNIRDIGVTAAAVLCQEETGDKNPRFRAVQEGSVPGLPPLQVVMWVGDNIQDFPGFTQAEAREAADAAFDRFGDIYWILPNPVYGSWEENPL